MNAPPTAAMPTNAPRMRPIPTAVSPKAINLPKKTSQWLSTMNWMKLRYQSYVMTGLAGAAGIAAIRCQKASSPEPS